MASVISFITANYGMICMVLLGISEALANIPAIKANSIFQMIVGIIQGLAPKNPAP